LLAQDRQPGLERSENHRLMELSWRRYQYSIEALRRDGFVPARAYLTVRSPSERRLATSGIRFDDGRYRRSAVPLADAVDVVGTHPSRTDDGNADFVQFHRVCLSVVTRSDRRRRGAGSCCCELASHAWSVESRSCGRGEQMLACALS